MSSSDRSSTTENNRLLTAAALGVGMGALGFAVGLLFGVPLIGLAIALALVVAAVGWFRR